MTRIENLGLGMILFLALGVRLMGIDQPIVENYVGRQIPTAMVARNLERRSSFLYPELDVAPRPNYFLIEPPLYAEIAVLVRRLTGLPLGASGRVVSALGIALGAWGLFGLVRRRVSIPTALVAMAVFVCLPVTIRYGRGVSARCAHDRLLDRGDALLGRLRSRTTADLAGAGGRVSLRRIGSQDHFRVCVCADRFRSHAYATSVEARASVRDGDAGTSLVSPRRLGALRGRWLSRDGG